MMPAPDANIIDNEADTTEATEPSRRPARYINPWLAPLCLASIVGLWSYQGTRVLAIILLVSIAAHEAGHALMGVARKVKVTEAFVGFGPEVAAFTWRGCRIGIKLLLLGGHASFSGFADTETVPDDEEHRTFRSATRRSRAAIILAGVVVNLILAFGGFVVAGVKDGAPLSSASAKAVDDSVLVAEGTIDGLVGLFGGLGEYIDGFSTEEGPSDRFLSPVGASRLADQAANNSSASVWRLFAVLNVSLAVFNLIPLVPLDGGHFVLLPIEWAVSKVKGADWRIDRRKLLPVALTVLVALFSMSASALVLDIIKPAANPFS